MYLLNLSKNRAKGSAIRLKFLWFRASRFGRGLGAYVGLFWLIGDCRVFGYCNMVGRCKLGYKWTSLEGECLRE